MQKVGRQKTRDEEPAKQAAECSPGRKPGVGGRKKIRSPEGATENPGNPRQVIACRPLRGLNDLTDLDPPAYARGYYAAAHFVGYLMQLHLEFNPRSFCDTSRLRFLGLCVEICNHLLLLHDQLASHHVHAARKTKFAFFVWHQRNDNRLVQWQGSPDAEVAQHDLRSAGLVGRS